MKIAPHLFEAHLKCPTKCWLRAAGEPSAGNAYAEWVQAQNESYRLAETERLLAEMPPGESAQSPSAENLKASKWRLAVDAVAQVPYGSADSHVRELEPNGNETRGLSGPRSEQLLESRLHAIERVPAAGRGKAAQFIPIRFIFRNKLTKDDKLLLAFDALVLRQALGREIATGKIIHGDLRGCARSSRGNEAQISPPALERTAESQSLLTSAATSQTSPDDGMDEPQTVASAAQLANRPLIPSFSPDGGEGARRADEGDAAKAMNAVREFESRDLSRTRPQPMVTKVKTSALASEVRKRLEKITALLATARSADSLVRESQSSEETRGLSGSRSAVTPPDLVLNRHCAKCEFQARCRKIALEKDDLSLLAGVSAKERQKLRSKGIFTVTQLSYTFRPRRRPKRLRDKREKYHHALKALAIREQKIHIVGSPELKIEGTPVYLDVEGLPDRDFYYLIGLRIGHGDSAVQHSLWADTVEDEGNIWREFLAILETVEKPVLIHYGSYETTFLKEMAESHGSPQAESVSARAIASAYNLVSVMFAKIYFPTFSNGLKEIAGWLGYQWMESSPSGLRSICKRQEWERTRESSSKQTLHTYNSDDCAALEQVAKTASRVCLQPLHGSDDDGPALEITLADSLPSKDTMWPKFTSPIDTLESINKAGRWDYQRHRIYVRTEHDLKRATTATKTRRRRIERISKVIQHDRVEVCPGCHKKTTYTKRRIKTLYDVRFTEFGIRRWVVRYHIKDSLCRTCHRCFGTPSEFWQQGKYGRNLLALVVFQVIELCIPQRTVGESMNRLFRLGLVQCVINNLKASAARHYDETRQKVMSEIVKGNLVHADETRIVLKGKPAYVWVFATFREVVYFYADTREGDLPEKALKEFKGVLVSDFYAAYDSVPCAQQKCLIHLMRDLNDAVLDHPFDGEIRGIATQFGELLRNIVATIDRRGLKRHFLRKHGLEVERFYRHLSRTTYQSEAAIKCKERFAKNREKFFAFLDYDGVPWNNNSAEHAIKAFARLRRAIEGLSTPKGIEEYLILLSVCQTCKYMGVDFLDFLRSGEKDIHAFAESRRRRRWRTPTS